MTTFLSNRDIYTSVVCGIEPHEVRLIHAKEPGPNWRDDFDRYPGLWEGMERILCSRVHFKCIIVDGAKAY